jgi:hypothetical protein
MRADPAFGRGAGGRRPRRRGAALRLGAALLAVCTPMTAVCGAAGDRERSAGHSSERSLLAAARNTYLLRTGRVFFPDDQPVRPDVLPELTPTQIALIAEILASELEQIQTAQRTHAAMLAREFPGHDATRVALSIEPTLTGAAMANSQPNSGRIRIDARVVQAIYRAAMINAFDPIRDEAGADVPDAAETQRRQQRAFNEFDQFHRQVINLPSSPALSDLRALRTPNPERERALGRLMSDGLAMIEARFEMLDTLLRSQRLERLFLGAIRFMLAHEAGHVALAHPVSPADCGQAIANELTADRYAVLVSDLAAFPRIRDTMRHGSAPLAPYASVTSFTDYVPEPSDGHAPFFKYAYGLAGFDLRFDTVPNCLYPTPAVRVAAIAPFAEIIDFVHRLAMDDLAHRRYGSAQTRQRLGNRPFERIWPRLSASRLPADLAPLQALLTEIFYDTYDRRD